MTTKAVIFDLGNTLVSYWRPEDWPDVLARAIDDVTEHLRAWQLLRVNHARRDRAVDRIREASQEGRVRPLAGRLQRVFALKDKEMARGLADQVVEEFCKSLMRRGRVYPDAVPTLEAIRQRGLKTGLLSNSPWGSPAELWHKEIARLGLRDHLDAAAFCGEIGHRKPKPEAFAFICEKLDVPPGECLFVGDDPRWDIEGPRAVGMPAVLVDRWQTTDTAADDLSVVLAWLDERGP